MCVLATRELIFSIPVTFVRIFSTFIFIQTFSSGTFITIYKKQKAHKTKIEPEFNCSYLTVLSPPCRYVGSTIHTSKNPVQFLRSHKLNNFIFDVIFPKLQANISSILFPKSGILDSCL